MEENEHYIIDWNVHAPPREAAIDYDGNFVLDEKGRNVLQSNENVHVHIMIPERSYDLEK